MEDQETEQKMNDLEEEIGEDRTRSDNAIAPGNNDLLGRRELKG